jgi:DNA repair photolyase
VTTNPETEISTARPNAAAPPHRGAIANPPNRFEALHLEPDTDAEGDPEERTLPRTQFLRDASQSLITYNSSPDVGFEASINPYRGCEHGCIYCYARPFHEYLGFSSGFDFESKIMVKMDAAKLLREELSEPSWKPQVLAMSGVTDAFQPVERKLKLTRGCLEVLAEFRNPVAIVTKNQLVTRDVDLLSELARFQAAIVYVSVTSLDSELRSVLEPRTSPPAARLGAIRTLAQAGIPTGVLVAPVIPGLTDHEMPAILSAAADAGAKFASYITLRLPYAVAPMFEDWLERYYPARKDKVLNQIRSLRDGKLNDPNFGSRMRGHGIFADQLKQLFQVASHRAGIAHHGPELSTAAFRRPGGTQMTLALA